MEVREEMEEEATEDMIPDMTQALIEDQEMTTDLLLMTILEEAERTTEEDLPEENMVILTDIPLEHLLLLLTMKIDTEILMPHEDDLLPHTMEDHLPLEQQDIEKDLDLTLLDDTLTTEMTVKL
jgi:hypothetical protein